MRRVQLRGQARMKQLKKHPVTVWFDPDEIIKLKRLAEKNAIPCARLVKLLVLHQLTGRSLPCWLHVK